MASQGSSTVCYAIPIQPLLLSSPKTQLTSPLPPVRRLPLLPRHLPPSPRRLLQARLQRRFPNQHPPLDPRMDSRGDSYDSLPSPSFYCFLSTFTQVPIRSPKLTRNESRRLVGHRQARSRELHIDGFNEEKRRSCGKNTITIDTNTRRPAFLIFTPAVWEDVVRWMHNGGCNTWWQLGIRRMGRIKDS
jgi:hypothetical protein